MTAVGQKPDATYTQAMQLNQERCTGERYDREGKALKKDPVTRADGAKLLEQGRAKASMKRCKRRFLWPKLARPRVGNAARRLHEARIERRSRLRRGGRRDRPDTFPRQHRADA